MPVVTSTGHIADPRRLRWLKMLTAVQALAGANTKYDPKGYEPTTRLLWKLAKALGAAPNNNEPEPRLLTLILSRLNVFAGTRKAVPPTVPFFHSLAARKADPFFPTEEKILGELNRVQSFSTVGPPAVSKTAVDRDNTRLETEKKILLRLNQIIN